MERGKSQDARRDDQGWNRPQNYRSKTDQPDTRYRS